MGWAAELLGDFIFSVLLGRMLNVRPQISKQGGALAASSFGTVGAATSPWAIGWRESSTNTTWVAASSPVGSGRVNLVVGRR